MTLMRTIALSLAASATILAAVPAAAAEKLTLSSISAYFNDLKTAEAPFTQVNDDGSLSTGRLYLKRPGRARFEYDPPDNARVVAGGGAVVIFDPKSNQRPTSYPLGRTPLSIILSRDVNLSRANMVVGHEFDGTSTIVTARDPAHPEYGHIELNFTDAPVELRKWVIEDGGGIRTTVILGAMQKDVPLAESLFDTGTAEGESDR